MDDLRSRFRGYQGPRSVPEPQRAPQVRPTPVTPEKPEVNPLEELKEPVTPTPVPTSTLPAEEKPAAPAFSGYTPPAKTKKRRGKRLKLPKLKLSRRKLIIIAVVLVVGLGGAAFARARSGGQDDAYSLGGKSRTVDEKPDGSTEQVAAPTGTIRLVATGDMIAHDSINQNAKKPDGAYDYVPLMEKMKPYFQKADIRFCNQSTPAGGASFGITGYPTFNAPLEFARGIENVGCNLINIGTNHTNDKGQALIDATVASWDNRSAVLAVAGANRSAEEQAKVRYFTVKNVKFAFLAYSTYTNNKQITPYGVNMYSEALAITQLTEARAQADTVIVSMRWGTEYSPGINAEQTAVAQKLADLGADVVFGHGPHVLEPVKKLAGKDGRETLVWFSLGNFLNSQLDIESLIGGFASIEIDVATKKVTKVGFMPTYQHYEWTAEQKKRASAADLSARKNFTMVPLDEATDLLAKSQNNTTVQTQNERVKTILNQFTPVTMLTSAEF